MTFGFASLAADMIFLWSIQYFGNPDIPDKFKHFNHIFQILAELDPRWVDPYEVGALIALYDAKDVPLAISILDLGLAKNPDLWIFPLEAGHYAQLVVKDNDLARVYYKKAMDIPGSPPIVKRLYANAAFKTLDYDTAWATWREVYETSADEAVRKIASNHLYNIKSTVDGQAVRNAVFDFRTRAGRNPSSLDELVRAGLLREVPRDLDGRDYVYDPATGTITTRVNPWKR
jgi:tetratricopeptide (TPR) repeat protein